MLPLAREQQLELHRPPSALAVVLLGEVDEGAADAGAAMIGRRDQHPELARVIRDVMHPDAADDPAVSGRDGDLPGADPLGELGRRRPCRPVAPEPALRNLVHVVDEAGQVIDEPRVATVGRLQQADGDRLSRAHRSRVTDECERSNTKPRDHRRRPAIQDHPGSWDSPLRPG
jgi:hypothetical protein